MTLGFTGVVWFPRGATWNSTALNAGVGPGPLTAAGGAWTALSTSLADATATVAKVMADLGAGWEGVAADAALAKLAPFLGWTEQAATLAAATAAKAGAAATAHTVARVTMPSLAEIGAVQAAKVAAHTVGGSFAGAGAAAEAADRAMDLRAALVMEAYESASTMVAVPQSFTPPPPLVGGTTAAPAGASTAPVPQNTLVSDFLVNPAQAAQTVIGSLAAQAQNPTVVAAASQAGGLVGSGLQAVAGAGAALAPAAASAITGTGHAQSDPAVFRAQPGGDAGTVRAAGAGAGALGGTVGAASAAGTSRVTLPGGWGAASAVDAGTGQGGRGVPVVGSPVAERVDAAAAAAARSGQVGAPVGAGRGSVSDDEEHRTPGYLKNFEHFEDGRVVIPSVIGGER